MSSSTAEDDRPSKEVVSDSEPLPLLVLDTPTPTGPLNLVTLMLKSLSNGCLATLKLLLLLGGGGAEGSGELTRRCISISLRESEEKLELEGVGLQGAGLGEGEGLEEECKEEEEEAELFDRLCLECLRLELPVPFKILALLLPRTLILGFDRFIKSSLIFCEATIFAWRADPDTMLALSDDGKGISTTPLTHLSPARHLLYWLSWLSLVKS